jgi:two-component system sensor histidine kinase UhpB
MSRSNRKKTVRGTRGRDARRSHARLSTSARTSVSNGWESSSGFIRTAFDIHNGPAQDLASALRQFRFLEQRIPPTVPNARASLRASIASTQTALDTAREIIRLLRPIHPTPAAVPPEKPRGKTRDRHSLSASVVSLRIDNVGPLALRIQAALAAVGSEALANALRHGRAKHVAIRLRRVAENMVLEVDDDGKGIGGASHAAGPGMGLALMRDEVHLLGGRLSIRNHSPRGTRVKAIVPTAGKGRDGSHQPAKILQPRNA